MRLCPCCGQSVPSGFIPEIEFIHKQLTVSQIAILELLMQRSPNVVSYEALENAVWGDDPDGGPLTIRKVLHVWGHRIRKIVKEYGWELKCHWGVGYYLVKTDTFKNHVVGLSRP